MTSATDLSTYNEKRVIVTVTKPDTEAVEVEGKVIASNVLGIMIKPKGKTQPELIEAAHITSIAIAPEKPKALKAKKLKPIEDAGVKSHLLERHGIQVAWVNGASDEAATEYHNSLDHKELDLGHFHDATQTEGEAAIAEAEAAAESGVAAGVSA